MELRGKKCILRSVVSSDVDTILLWENDPTLAQYSDPHPPYSREQIVAFITYQQYGFEENGQLRLMIDVGSRAVGAIDLFDYDGTTAEVGVLVYNHADRKKGYATDALQTIIRSARLLGIECFKATIDSENIASRSLFRHCGFVNIDNNRYLCNMKRIVAPSILSADFGNLERDTLMLNRSAAEWVHIDVMDGDFVPNISFGFPVLNAVTKVSTKVIDTHLMISNPLRYVEKFAKAGSHYVTFHYEATNNIGACIDAIHLSGAKAGISIKPTTDVRVLQPWIDKLDMVLIMSVEPGFGGQSFIPESLDKVRILKDMITAANSQCLIEIDGGISATNAGEVFRAGVDVVVAGSAVFGAADPEIEIVKILNA